jgi:molybdate transport repressor ModE-like protein
MDKPPRPTRQEVFLNYKIWLSGLTGHGKVSAEAFALLEQTAKVGRLTQAAEAIGMSYRKAWGLIKEAEDILGYPLLDTQRGGKDGGNSSLTPAALKLLEAYHALQQKFDKQVEEAYLEFLAKLNQQ